MKFNKKLWEKGAVLESAEQVLRDRAIIPKTKEDLYDPFLLKDMSKAVERIRTALENNEYIWVFGDYDADGITSCAILIKYFDSLGARANYYIPDRVSDGYGLSASGLDEIAAKGGNLVITVDCGINAFEEAHYAKTLGLDLIITDHHMVEEELPEAVAVINPKRGGYPFEHLAGCGVAFKLVQALAGDAFPEFRDSVLDIVAFGTIADVVSITDENWVIVKEGLAHFKNIGLRALSDMACKDPDRLKTSDIGFSIGPMINASGRIGNPKIAVELLLTDDNKTAYAIAKQLHNLNTERQEQCTTAESESADMIEKHVELSDTYVVVARGDDWHVGVMGIVASRLVERYGRPAIALTRSEDGSYKGSARSVYGVSIYDILSDCREYLDRFGGHAYAAGITISEANYEPFLKALQQAGRKHMGDCFVGKRRCDYKIEPKQITMDFIEQLSRLRPFGAGNPEPVFRMDNLFLDSIRYVGALGNHAKITVNAGSGIFDAICFGMADSFKGIRMGEELSLLFVPEISHFGGVDKIQLKVKDIHSGAIDFHDELKRAMDRATAKFIIEQPSYSFTRLLDFDKIKQLGQVDIYTYEDMKKIQKWIYDEDLDHEIVFGDAETENPCLEEGGILIRFMPTPSGVPNATGAAFADFVTIRKDVEEFYRFSKRTKGWINISIASGRLRMPVPKILVALEMLKLTGILEYRLVNDIAYLKWVKPDRVKKLEEIELFQRMERETTLSAE